MKKVINNLREKSILHRDQVMNIKKYIDGKYKGEEASRKAAIFADAVHNIVDESVKKFEKQHRLQIRAEVLKTAIAKDVFDISGYDVFEVCSLIPIEGDDESLKEQFLENLTEWINENQDEVITVEDTKVMTAEIIDAAVFEVVNLLEESVLIEPEIKDLAGEDKAIESGPKEFVDSSDLSMFYDEQELDDHITDGRFMDTEGETVELSASDIEKAIKDSKELYGDLDDIEVEERIDKSVLRKAISEQESLEEQDSIAEQVVGTITVQESEEEEVFDSMDFFQQDVTEAEWTEAEIKHSKVETTRLSGYELNPPRVGEDNPGVSLRVKLIIIIPAILVTIALIIILILGALSVSKRNAMLEQEIEELKEAALNSVVLIQETIPPGYIDINEVEEPSDIIEGVNYSEGGHLAEIIQYKSINPELLKEYLVSKNSKLAEDYYIETFIQVAKDYNVNPLLLVAITGQEQNFVPVDHPDVELMKNNPFNVYGSWKTTDSDFEESCQIAARTVLTSSQGRPTNEDPIKWINDHKYAEDQNWHKGVTYFFNEMAVLILPD